MTTDRTDRYSRRAFLKGLGLGLGMLPLLHSEKVIAQTAGVAKRLISITWTNGIVPGNFYPVAGPLLGTLPPILAPLEAWKSKILAMRGAGSGPATGGIDCQVMVDAGLTFFGHNAYPSLLTGAAPSSPAGITLGSPLPSIDTLIADQLKTQGFATPQLTLGCRPGTSATSWRAGGLKNLAEVDPFRLYTRLFAGISTTSPIDLLTRRRSVIDFGIDDFTRFSARLGTDDRVKIDAHLDSIRAIERQLMATPPVTGAACKAPPSPPAGLNFRVITNFPAHVKLMLDMLAAAVKCDIARTFTVDLVDDGGGSGIAFPWLGIPSPDYHAIAHAGAASYAEKTVIDTWFYSQIASLVGQLAANPEGASTSLDNSTILVSNGMNEGATSAVTSLPYLIIGSGGGFFKQGTCVEFPVNVPNNQLLTSVCHAMDLQLGSVGMTYTGDLDAILKA